MDAPALNVFTIRKIAAAKGYSVERTATLKQRPFVQIYDPKGRVVDGAKTGNGFSLTEAKRLLEAMPDGVSVRETVRRKAKTRSK